MPATIASMSAEASIRSTISGTASSWSWSAHFNMTNDENYPPYSGYGTVQVPVECLPYQGASGDVT